MCMLHCGYYDDLYTSSSLCNNICIISENHPAPAEVSFKPLKDIEMVPKSRMSALWDFEMMGFTVFKPHS